MNIKQAIEQLEKEIQDLEEKFISSTDEELLKNYDPNKLVEQYEEFDTADNTIANLLLFIQNKGLEPHEVKVLNDDSLYITYQGKQSEEQYLKEVERLYREEMNKLSRKLQDLQRLQFLQNKYSIVNNGEN